MITVSSFFSDTMNTVDAVIGNFVNAAYTNFVHANSGMITLMFTVYVMFIGYQFLSHTHHFNVSMIVKNMIIMLCVYGMVMNWNLYNIFVYNIFTNEPGRIAQVLVNSAGHAQSGLTIVKALDGIYQEVINSTINLLGQASFSFNGILFIVYGGFVFCIGIAMCVFALLLFIYAKMMMAIALALGPIFILFVLWRPTQGMFSSWLSMIITIAFIPIVTSAILALMLSVINVTLPSIQQPGENQQLYGLAPFLGLSLTTSLILAQVFRICGAFGGGITLASLSAGAAIAGSVLQKSGSAWAGRQISNWTRKKSRQIKRRILGNN